MTFTFSIDHWELKAPFVTSQEELFAIETLTVFLEDGGHRGRGEALGVDYLGENARRLSHQLMACSREIDAGLDRDALQELLPPGGARNALDCALWDLECKRSGRRAWERARLDVAPVQTVYTLAMDRPEAMAKEARANAERPALKLKLDAGDALARVTAVREARPDASLVVDANGGWDADLLERLGGPLADLGVDLLEQPLPRGEDAVLERLNCPVPLCADESCQHIGELDAVVNRYDAVNVKLDKCGGLTAGLALAEAVRDRGLECMVGNMLGTSLAMAPAFLVAQHCRWVDLDGPLWLRGDHDHPLVFDGGRVEPPDRALWG